LPQRIHQRRPDLLCSVEGGVGENLVDVGAVGLAHIVGEPLPAVLVELSQVGFVLGVDDVNDVAAEDDDVGNEVPQ
jgi:hypothetical protein